jgi:hypothetical protein
VSTASPNDILFVNVKRQEETGAARTSFIIFFLLQYCRGNSDHSVCVFSLPIKGVNRVQNPNMWETGCMSMDAIEAGISLLENR